MKALMFGWEFPPHILGGLGTASYGLTKEWQKMGIWIFHSSFRNRMATRTKFRQNNWSCDTPIAWRDTDWDYVNSRIGNVMDPQLYFDLRDHIYADFNYMNVNDLGCIDFSGRYPDNLLEEINNYSIVAGVSPHSRFRHYPLP